MRYLPISHKIFVTHAPFHLSSLLIISFFTSFPRLFPLAAVDQSKNEKSLFDRKLENELAIPPQPSRFSPLFTHFISDGRLKGFYFSFVMIPPTEREGKSAISSEMDKRVVP
ncbi:hypothetical protein TNCT_126331 [Trichonephila clavata]|uniref:Uncharacterized protein n=1 Tax=Trichonephila clavata TaxID=2740835 RepID=A0A8X6GYZ3_TRICU|nr:hypothetical protein TNCT_126331 [Trichonephila clavata]